MNDFFKSTINIIKQKSKEKYWLVPFCVLVLWIIDTIVSVFSTGFARMDLMLIILIIAKIGVLVYNLFIFWQLFIMGELKHYNHFKTFTGYATVFIYVFYSLPRLSWEIQKILPPSASLRLWIFSFVSAFIAFCMYWILRNAKTQLKWKIVTEEELKERKAKKKDKKDIAKPKKSVKEHIIENIHVVVQAIITVIIIQNFTIQLYEIPSESMVPTFLRKDRVFVTKFQYGPTIPLTNWRLPSIVPLKKGDVVVFESPEYVQNDVMKKILYEFVFYLSLSTINIDKDENGEVKKQLIVKRLVGMPGEKLKMLDDVLYVKKEGDSDFKVMEEDKQFAHVDLYKEPYETAKRIEYMAVNEERRKLLTKWDNWKKNTTLEELNGQLTLLADKISEKLNQVNSQQLAVYFEKIFTITQPNYKNEIGVVENFLKWSNTKPFEDIGIIRATMSMLRPEEISKTKFIRRSVIGYDQLMFWNLLKNSQFASQIRTFLLSTILDNNTKRMDDYEIAMRKLNVKLKIMLAQKYNTYLDLFITGIDVNKAKDEIAAYENLPEFSELFIYIQMHYDSRNFPEYPAGDKEYIPAHKYFLMGDNRYNSLDFRFSHNVESWPFVKLDQYDSHSVTYQSQLDIHLLDRKNILGTGKVRVWPPNRWGTF